MRLFKERLSVTSRLTARKEVHRILREHFDKAPPKYDIDISFLPCLNFSYYGHPGSCYLGLTISWIVWDISLRWKSNGLPKPIPRKQTQRR